MWTDFNPFLHKLHMIWNEFGYQLYLLCSWLVSVPALVSAQKWVPVSHICAIRFPALNSSLGHSWTTSSLILLPVELTKILSLALVGARSDLPSACVTAVCMEKLASGWALWASAGWALGGVSTPATAACPSKVSTSAVLIWPLWDQTLHLL